MFIRSTLPPLISDTLVTGLAPTGALYVIMHTWTQLFTFLTQHYLWIASIVSIQLKATLKRGFPGPLIGGSLDAKTFDVLGLTFIDGFLEAN